MHKGTYQQTQGCSFQVIENDCFLSSVPKAPRSTRPERYSFSAEKFGRTTANAVNIKVCKVLPRQCLFLAVNQGRD